MNDAIGCPRHSVSLVRQIASGNEPVAYFKCPEKDCNVSAPEAGCLFCGHELEVIDVSAKTEPGSLWSAILRCADHGDWWWQQRESHMRKVDDGLPGRIALLRKPGLSPKAGDLVVKPIGATSSHAGTTFYTIDEWPLMHRIEESPFEDEDRAIARGKVLTERRGVRLWRDLVEGRENNLQGPIF